MKHLYLFTLEITALEIGKVYDELPSHLTLMSRFLSELSAEALASKVRPLFAQTSPVHLVFGETMQLGPKKVTAHMVDSPEENRLHNDLSNILCGLKVEYQYPEFIRDNHKPHVTARDSMSFTPGSTHVTRAAYLIEIVDRKRVVEAKLELKHT